MQCSTMHNVRADRGRIAYDSVSKTPISSIPGSILNGLETNASVIGAIFDEIDAIFDEIDAIFDEIATG